jgi:hypothetical protein
MVFAIFIIITITVIGWVNYSKNGMEKKSKKYLIKSVIILIKFF